MFETSPAPMGRSPVPSSYVAATRFCISFPEPRAPDSAAAAATALRTEVASSTEIAAEVTQGPLARERRSGRIVGSPLIAIEPMIRGIDKHFDVGMRRGESLDAIDRYHRIALAEVRHHGTFRRFGNGLEHASTVISDSTREAGQSACAHP